MTKEKKAEQTLPATGIGSGTMGDDTLDSSAQHSPLALNLKGSDGPGGGESSPDSLVGRSDTEYRGVCPSAKGHMSK